MNFTFKRRLLITAFALLILGNIILVSLLVIKNTGPAKMMPPHGRIDEYIIEQLALNASQQSAYQALVKEHQLQAREIREQINTAQQKLFDLLGKTGSDSLVRQAAGEVGKNEQNYQLATFTHFEKLRQLCTPVQQAKLDNMIKDILQMMGGTGSGPTGPPAGPNGGRPPGPPPGE